MPSSHVASRSFQQPRDFPTAAVSVVSTASHAYTHKEITATLPFFRQMTYPALFTHRRLPRATYIFSDFDRLNFWQVELAAHVYRILKAAGCRVMNDPARVLSRLGLLRRLNAEGVNSFNAWPASEASAVDRFPAFIRTISAHRGNLTDTLPDKATLVAELDRLVDSGLPLSDLMISEYRAAPVRDDVFQKLSIYRIGDRLFQGPSVHERHWSAKYGEHGLGGAETYAKDLRSIQENPHRHILLKAFNLASIDYGRADFGIVNGQPEIYEINTNPSMDMAREHPFEDRVRAIDITKNLYNDAMREVDGTNDVEQIRISRPDQFTPKQKLRRVFPGHQWTP